MEKLIYIADDEQNIRELIKSFLIREGYNAVTFPDGSSLLEAFLKKPSDMVILDIMMPGLDGLSLCTALRQKSTVPIIMVSARDSDIDRIAGITLGSDDYLTKPFSPMELVIRVKALFRRMEMDKGLPSDFENICIGNVTIMPDQKIAKCNGEDLELTLTELKLLTYLAKNRNRAIGRDELLNKVWGFESEADTRATDDTVKRIRKKLASKKSSIRIETVWGFGFKITAGEDNEQRFD